MRLYPLAPGIFIPNLYVFQREEEAEKKKAKVKRRGYYWLNKDEDERPNRFFLL